MPNVNIQTSDWLGQMENILEEPHAGVVIANDGAYESYSRKSLCCAGSQGSRSCPSADGHPETMKIARRWTDMVRASRPQARERPAPAPRFSEQWVQSHGEERGWRRRAVVWHVCASLMLKGRIHPDTKRRDVCATHMTGLRSPAARPHSSTASAYRVPSAQIAVEGR